MEETIHTFEPGGWDLIFPGMTGFTCMWRDAYRSMAELILKLFNLKVAVECTFCSLPLHLAALLANI